MTIVPSQLCTIGRSSCATMTLHRRLLGALGLFASSILQQAAELEVVVADDLKKEEATGTQEEAPAKKDIQTRIKQASDNSWIRITAVWCVVHTPWRLPSRSFHCVCFVRTPFASSRLL